MIHLGSCSEEGNQLEIGPCTEEVSLSDNLLLDVGVALHLIDNQVGIVDDTIHTGIDTRYHTVVGIEVVLVEFLHVGVVTATATSAPDVVREQIECE